MLSEKFKKKYCDERICVVESCKKVFYVLKPGRKNKRMLVPGLRQRNCKTCSKECTKTNNKLLTGAYKRKRNTSKIS